MELYQLVTTAHIIGAVLGAGGAVASDLLFLKSLKDKRIDKIELSFLRMMSVLVWVGLGLLIASGVALFVSDPTGYLASDKFLAKMTIVILIAINGLVFHFLHIPFLKKKTNVKLFASLPKGEGAVLILSGVVSAVSWFSALVLGTLRGLPYSYETIMAIYVTLLMIGAFGTLGSAARDLAAAERRIIIRTAVGFLVIALLLAYVVVGTA